MKALEIKRIRNPENNLSSHPHGEQEEVFFSRSIPSGLPSAIQLPLLRGASTKCTILRFLFHPRENFEYGSKCKRCTYASLPLARGGGPLAVEGIVRDTKILPYARKIKRVRNLGNNLISHLRCQLPLLGEALLLCANLRLLFYPRGNFER